MVNNIYMDSQLFISILLGILAFVGSMMVKQLMKIAEAVNRIQQELGILANDHVNLKTEVIDVKNRVTKIEESKTH